MSDNLEKTPPEWMLRLENKKKRPHRLAHEIGAGAPCFTCGDACPGLDLHFWRKLCRNCKCRKEDHDVKDDEGYEQFEILLGTGGRRRKTGAVLKIKVPEEVQSVVREPSNKGVAFDWVPPNVSEDVAAEYMRQLPAGKLPISGSDGALYRRQQLEKQVPLHDLDASRCDSLTQEEIEGLKKYLDNLKSNVVGQGCVSKVPVLYSETRLLVSAPHQLHSSSRPLASSQSADSIRTLPPIPSLYNTVPQPFSSHTSGGDEDDLPPPPLPDSLPPGVGTADLRTPSTFIPQWTLPPHKMAHSTTVPGLHHGSSSVLGEPGFSVTFAAPGLRVVSKDGSLTLHSTGIAGHEAQYSGLIGAVGSPSDSDLSALHVDQATAWSGSAPGQAAQFSRPLLRDARGPQDATLSAVKQSFAQSSSLPCDGVSVTFGAPGSRVVSKDGSQTLYSTGVQGHEAQYSGLLRPSGTPHDAQFSALYHDQDVSKSSLVPGQTGQFSKPLPHNTRGPQGNVSHGQLVHDPLFGTGDNPEMTSMLPRDGTVTSSISSSDVAHSSIAPGKVTPSLSARWSSQGVGGIDPKLEALSGSRRSTGVMGHGVSEDYAVETLGRVPQHGTLSSSGAPYSSGVSGQQHGTTVPGYHGLSTFNNLGSTIGHQGALPYDQTADAARQAVPGMDMYQRHEGPRGTSAQYGSVTRSGPSANASLASIPLDGVMMASLHSKDVAASTAVGTDAMPKSAHVMHQSHPQLDPLAGQMAQVSMGAEDSAILPLHLDCHECKLPVRAGEVAVFAERAGESVAWHPQCFVCHSCKELLVDLIYFFNAGDVYCGRHFAQLLSIPRCYACDELIFVKEYTVAEGNAFHVKHFCCFECDEPLAGKQYVSVEEQPVCLDCFQNKYGKRCHTCKKQIAASDQRVGWKELSWHVEGNCFCCYQCQKSLLGGRFVVKENHPFCSKECVQAAYTAKLLTS